jgi:hypothetical protein
VYGDTRISKGRAMGRSVVSQVVDLRDGYDLLLGGKWSGLLDSIIGGWPWGNR